MIINDTPVGRDGKNEEASGDMESGTGSGLIRGSQYVEDVWAIG